MSAPLLRRALLRLLLVGALLASLLGLPAAPALAGPVNWQELPASEAGQQWWDSGSLRRTRSGTVSVLSRFLPAAGDDGKPRMGDLYVMELDCDQQLYRDTSVNGLPRFQAEWQPSGGDDLIDAVIEAACRAAADLPA